MKKALTIVICVLMFLSFTAASKRSVKAVKTPKVTVAGLSKELKAANIEIEELTAQKVSITAKAAALETDIKKLKKEKNSMMFPMAILGLLVLTLAAFLTASMAKKSGEVKEARKKAESGGSARAHFEEIEAYVLDDWYNIWYHPEKVKKELYDDLVIHFPELYGKMEKWKADISRRGIFTGHMISLLSTKFPDVEGTDSIYLLALEGNAPFIEETEIAVDGAVCASLKRNVPGNIKLMKEYYNEVSSQFKGEFKEVREVTNEIALLKDEIDIDIRKIKHHRKIQGACKFIKS